MVMNTSLTQILKKVIFLYNSTSQNRLVKDKVCTSLYYNTPTIT